jgi:hypothetical protein
MDEEKFEQFLRNIPRFFKNQEEDITESHTIITIKDLESIRAKFIQMEQRVDTINKKVEAMDELLTHLQARMERVEKQVKLLLEIVDILTAKENLTFTELEKIKKNIELIKIESKNN